RRRHTSFSRDWSSDVCSSDLVLSLAEALPEDSVIGMAATGDPAYRADTPATVYGWGDTTGGGSYAGSLHAARVRVLPDRLCQTAIGRASCRASGRVADGRA